MADVSGLSLTTTTYGSDPDGAAGLPTVVLAAAQRGEVARIEVRGPGRGGSRVHLPIALGLVERHGGVLQPHELPNHAGTTYVVELPLDPAAARAAAARAAAGAGRLVPRETDTAVLPDLPGVPELTTTADVDGGQSAAAAAGDRAPSAEAPAAQPAADGGRPGGQAVRRAARAQETGPSLGPLALGPGPSAASGASRLPRRRRRAVRPPSRRRPRPSRAPRSRSARAPAPPVDPTPTPGPPAAAVPSATRAARPGSAPDEAPASRCRASPTPGCRSTPDWSTRCRRCPPRRPPAPAARPRRCSPPGGGADSASLAVPPRRRPATRRSARTVPTAAPPRWSPARRARPTRRPRRRWLGRAVRAPDAQHPARPAARATQVLVGSGLGELAPPRPAGGFASAFPAAFPAPEAPAPVAAPVEQRQAPRAIAELGPAPVHAPCTPPARSRATAACHA